MPRTSRAIPWAASAPAWPPISAPGSAMGTATPARSTWCPIAAGTRKARWISRDGCRSSTSSSRPITLPMAPSTNRGWASPIRIRSCCMRRMERPPRVSIRRMCARPPMASPICPSPTAASPSTMKASSIRPTAASGSATNTAPMSITTRPTASFWAPSARRTLSSRCARAWRASPPTIRRRARRGRSRPIRNRAVRTTRVSRVSPSVPTASISMPCCRAR